MKKLISLFSTFFIIIFVLFLYFYKNNYFEVFNNKIYDIFFQIRGYKKPSNDIVILNIDEKSLKSLGQWPWSRNIIAKIIQNATNAGAGIIGMDIVFSEKDRTSPSLILKKYKQCKIKNLINYDKILAKTISQSPIILGYTFLFDQNKSGVLPQIPAIFIEKNAKSNYLLNAKGIVSNIPIIQNNAYSSGFFNMIPDSDGVVRRVPLVIKYKGMIYPSLDLEILRTILGENKVFINYSDVGVDNITIGNLKIPVDEHARFFINYRGPSFTYKYISAVDIYNNNFDPNLIKGKILLFGTSAVGLLDLRATPYDNTMPGIEIHANILDNLINQNFISKPNWIYSVEILLIILLGFILGYIFYKLSAIKSFILFLIVINGYLLLSYYLMFHKGILINVLYILIEITLLFIVLTLINYFYEGKQKEIIKKMFEKKVSPQVVEDLLNKKSLDEFEIKEKEITIFFSDVRSFTTISEEIGSPKRLIDMLNQYMTPMVDIIMKYKGTIDKFIGDAIMAYWNAPNEVKNHATYAVKSAIEQMKYLNTLNETFKSQNLPKIDIGIGIHTGLAIVGEMGSSGRSDYTVIGDSVNLASRLEGLNKFYGTHIIISEDTKNKLDKEIITRELDYVKVKGKHKAIKIYEVIYYEIDQNELNEYKEALNTYRNKNFELAFEKFEKLATLYNRKIYNIYLKRANEFKLNPQHYKEEYEFTTK